ncbi:MAG: class II aldolase/adducin family protein [Firmicutes bacterium]|nr:class II aldolase/adducin family protein [Bacillota bacterium]
MYIKKRQAVVEAGREMARSALAVGTWGNISCRVEPELMAITPSGMDYEQLQSEDIVIMDLGGQVREGSRKPSSEQPLHRAIYRGRPDIQAVVHTHSVYASALAVARKPIPACVEDLVQIVGGAVRVADYCLPGTEELGECTLRALEGRNGALLANHGVIGCGRTLTEALTVCKIIEKAAKITLAAQAVGGVVELAESDIQAMRTYYLHQYGQR